MENYIQQALRTESPPDSAMIDRLGNNIRLVHALMGLTTETGELMDSLKRHVYYGTPLDMVNLKEEIGDVLWYLAMLLDCCNLTLEECQAANINKLQTRYASKFSSDEAVNRKLEAEREALEN